MQRWMEIDGKVIALAKTQAGLDYEIGVVLLEAKRERVWTKIPFGSFYEYADRRFGWDGRMLRERLRVAERLEKLPLLARALQNGEVSWSAIREITRIAQARNAGKWLAAAKTNTVRGLERMVAVRRKGDDPDSPPDPTMLEFVVALKMKAEPYAKTVNILDLIKEHLGDPSITEAEANLVALQFWAEQHQNAEPRPPYQVAITKDADGRGFVTARGERIEVTPETIAKAECDAHVISAEVPVRACRTVSPATSRLNSARAGWKCEVPGCRNRFGLEDHHVILKSEGGSNDETNLVKLCSAHHDRFHDGTLLIEGTRATGYVYKHADGSIYGQPIDPERTQAFVDAFGAMRTMGVKDKDARRVLAEIRALMPDAKVEEIIRVAMKRLTHVGRSVADDAIDGLKNLGFKEADVRNAVAGVIALMPDAKVEDVLRHALRELGKRKEEPRRYVIKTEEPRAGEREAEYVTHVGHRHLVLRLAA